MHPVDSTYGTICSGCQLVGFYRRLLLGQLVRNIVSNIHLRNYFQPQGDQAEISPRRYSINAYYSLVRAGTLPLLTTLWSAPVL
jgi:hypothetical protein